MNAKASFLLGTALVLAIIGSVSATYYRAFIARNYQITAQIACDPAIESCFVQACDPEAGACDGSEPPIYYKLMTRNAKQALSCKNNDGSTCIATTCAPNEVGCEITNCDPTAPDATCSNPEQSKSKKVDAASN